MTRSADFDDPLMPFVASISSSQWEYDPIAMQYVQIGDIQLPTATPLRIVVNLFIEAGCSDASIQNCELDVTEAGGASLGIELFESGVALTSGAGFEIPVVPAPEPAAGASFAVACAALASLRRERRGCESRYAAPIQEDEAP